MHGLRYTLIRAAFEALTWSGLPGLMREMSSARGVIFTLHRVLPDAVADFLPNAILQVTPKFLDTVIAQMRELGFDLVSMDEALTRLAAKNRKRPFAVFTFDDAYRDNLVHALPVLRKRNCPFTLYVPTAFVDGVGEVWWQALEDIVALRDGLSVDWDGQIEYYRCRSTAEKMALYKIVYSHLRQIDEDARVAMIRELAARAGFDLGAHCRSLIMDWPELQAFADEPLCTIGAHTVHHYELSKLDAARARSEIAESLRVIEIQLGKRPRHFSYPIGSRVAAGPREYEMVRELGLSSGVTTIPGGLYRRHAANRLALPRISLNGYFQKSRYVSLFATGGLFSLIGRA